MRMTLKQKADTRTALRNMGQDPLKLSPAEFIAFAKELGTLKDTPRETKPETKPIEPAPVKPKPETKPAPVKTAPVPGSLDEMVQAKIDQALEGFKPGDIESQLASLIAEHVTTTINVTVDHKPAEKTIKIDGVHEQYPLILDCLIAGITPYLYGEAGSGKTTMAEQCAQAMELPFYLTGKIDEYFDLVGFRDATGHYEPTAFYKAFTSGGVFLFDEMDGSSPAALTRFNAALANGYCDFPDGVQKMHPDFKVVGAGNTSGHGANARYIRNQLDGATLDRFVSIEINYDEALELRVAKIKGGDTQATRDWVSYVQTVRAQILKQDIPLLVSPRASFNGAELLQAGVELSTVKQICIWKGCTADIKALLS